MTKKKAETKAVPPPIDDAAPGRVTMETVVTDGLRGITRLKHVLRRIMPAIESGNRDDDT